MTWTNLSFAFGSVLTSAKMTQLYDNFAAMANDDAGAPSIVNGALTGHPWGTADIQSSAVARAILDTATVTLSGTIAATSDVTFTMNGYAFFPMIHVDLVSHQLIPHGTDGASPDNPRFGIRNEGGATSNYDIDYRYVVA